MTQGPASVPRPPAQSASLMPLTLPQPLTLFFATARVATAPFATARIATAPFATAPFATAPFATALTLLLASSGCALGATQRANTTPPGEQAALTRDSTEVVDVPLSTTPSPYFVVDGEPLCFAGANNYYLMYKPRKMVSDVLDVAQRMNLKVLRMWAFLDRGSLDGNPKTGEGASMPSIRPPGHEDGVYFQYWDQQRGQPAFNDGEDGLVRLDYAISEARRRGLLLTLVLTNNWRDFGGMDQYLTWYGLKQHHQFYTDARVRAAYKNWVAHVITRTNSIDGVPYIDDPTIFAWELANEPRTINYENFDHPANLGTETITAWADEMSSFIKALDPHHMVAVGDEGFLNSGGRDWAHQAAHGVDSEQLTALPHVDFGTYHLYPDHWKFGTAWGNTWIAEHIALSRRVEKPLVLEEYGLQVRRKEGDAGPIVAGLKRREIGYANWTRLVARQGGQAALFWILSGWETEAKRYPDYDHFTVYEHDPTYQLLRPTAELMRTEATACTLARGTDHGTPSPYASARPAPGSATAVSSP